MKYIDEEKYRKKIAKKYWQEEKKRGIKDPYVEAIDWCLGVLVRQPTADVQEVRHGKWIKEHFVSESGEFYHTCSNCDMELKETYSDNYCPNCGAKMESDNITNNIYNCETCKKLCCDGCEMYEDAKMDGDEE